jgi:capsular polysaccharide biosynthesis protein
LLLEDYDISDLEKVFSISYSGGDPSISASQIKSLVSISSVNDTEVISISATTENPQLSADICTYISEVAPSLLTRVTQAGSVEPVGTAKVPTSPSSPNVKKITMIGFMLGFVLAVAIVVIADLIDNRIKFADDFKKKFSDIPVLSEIPDMSETESKVRY